MHSGWPTVSKKVHQFSPEYGSMVSQPSLVFTGRRSFTLLYPAGPIGGTKAWPPSISMLLKAATVSSIGTSTSWPLPVRSR